MHKVFQGNIYSKEINIICEIYILKRIILHINIEIRFTYVIAT